MLIQHLPHGRGRQINIALQYLTNIANDKAKWGTPMPIQMDSKPFDDSPIPTTAVATTRMATACQSIASAALHSNDVMTVFDKAVADVGAVLNLDMVRIFLFDRETASLNPKAQFARFTAGCPVAYPTRLGEAIVQMVAASGESAIFENAGEESFFAGFHESRTTGQYPCGFFAAFPMRGNLSHSGALVCINRRPRELSAIESNFLGAVVGQLTMALDYFRLSESLGSAERELPGRSSEHNRENPTHAQIAEFVSCEVRSRLTSILGYVQLLQEQFLGRINSKQADALDTIASESGSLLETLMSSIEGCPEIAPHN
ncbi:MAG: GAF domain-containing protein [Candidatus Binatia bacterium]